jgi:prepilin-type N-terminal cleavage/methylation domain-containing protein
MILRPHHRSHPRRGRRAYTLVELSASLAIIGMLLVATGSAIVLASRAVPNRTSAPSRAVSAAAALEQLGAELAYATSVSEMGDAAVQFTLPDRTGDGAAEVVRWAWDANPGAPLTRSMNGAAPAVMLEDVRQFALVYDRRREQLPDTYTESAEALLFQQDSASNGLDVEITSQNWVGQTLRLTFAPDVAWWAVTRVLVKAQARSSSDGETRVQLRGADLLGNPTLVVHDQAALLERTLMSNYKWCDMRLNRRARLVPGEPVCVVMRWVSDKESCEVQLRNLYPPGGAVQTTNGGLTWTPAVAQSMQLQVYGVTAKRDPPRCRYALNDVRVTIRAGADAQGAAVSAAVATVNLPEVPAP